ncbi:MAG: TetR family transcriptional regulator [Desulfobacterales bacterium]|nr:TetR family transcriptional regulator [Desulfobacterales bacterium]MCP4162201.1 TetR family transcriptional regulator [Deltaproteobacteria bacterium]
MKRLKNNKINRELLLEQGIELISEFGYHGTGLKKILDKVKIPKGSFYNYFDSKEHYVSEIIIHYSKDLINRIDTYIDSTNDDPVTTMKNVYYTAIKEIEIKGQKGCLLGNLAAEIGLSSEQCAISMNEAFNKWKIRFVKLIEKAQKEDLIRDDLTAETLTDIFWDTWEGSLLRTKIDNNTSDLKKTVDVILDTLFVVK